VGGYTGNGSSWLFCADSAVYAGFCLGADDLGHWASVLGMAMAALVGPLCIILGAVAICDGLVLLEVFHLPMPQCCTRLPETEPGNGCAIALGRRLWGASSPCGTPFLTAILGFISRSKTGVLGGLSCSAMPLRQSMLLLWRVYLPD